MAHAPDAGGPLHDYRHILKTLAAFIRLLEKLQIECVAKRIPGRVKSEGEDVVIDSEMDKMPCVLRPLKQRKARA